MKDYIVYLVTGATSGVGEALARRLLNEAANVEDVVLCLACRNLKKASRVQDSLLASFPKATVDTVYLDTSQPATAVQAGKKLKQRYKHINYLYFNAGIMPVSGLNWRAFWPPTPSNYSRLFGTGVGLLRQQDDVTTDGQKLIFTTNVTGHYVLFKELEPFLERQGKPCHVIWTSSSSANHVEIDCDDVENRKGVIPYHTSKRAIDLLSMRLNEKMNSKGIYSNVTCPGMVISQMTYGMLPKWVWYCLMPLWFLIRMFVTNFYTLSAGNGAEALVWLSKQDPSSLDHKVKYSSMCSAYGKKYVAKTKMNDAQEATDRIIRELDTMAGRFLNDTKT